MSAAQQTPNDLIGHFMVKRITGKWPKLVEPDFLGTAWCWFETGDGKAYWLYVPAEKLIDSSRNTGKE